MKIFLTILSIFYSVFSFAQKKQNIYYLDDNEKFVENKEDAAFYRIIEEPDSGSRSFKLYEFYLNGKSKKTALLFKFYPYLIFDNDKIISYNKNGKIKSVEKCFHNSLTDYNYYYYENGKLSETIFYSYKGANLIKKTFQLFDTLGTNLLDKNSSGKIDIVNLENEKILGTYKNGFKEGIWNITNKLTKEKIIENYVKGKLVSGKRIDSLGKVILYNYVKTIPSSSKRETEFQSNRLCINLKLNYSHNFINRYVTMSFDLDKFGTVKDLKVLESVSKESDKQALESVTRKIWYPAKIRGVPVDSYNIIISGEF